MRGEDRGRGNDPHIKVRKRLDLEQNHAHSAHLLQVFTHNWIEHERKDQCNRYVNEEKDED